MEAILGTDCDLFIEGDRVPLTPRDMSDDGIAIRLARMYQRGNLISSATEAAHERIQRGLGLLATLEEVSNA